MNDPDEEVMVTVNARHLKSGRTKECSVILPKIGDEYFWYRCGRLLSLALEAVEQAERGE